MNKLVLLVLFFVICASVSALGTFPGRTTIDFTPGLQQTVSFTIVNSEQRDVNVVISAQGELQSYVSIPETAIRMKAGESREVSYVLNLPQTLPPGLHTADVVVIQVPEQFVETGQMSIGAAVAVLTQVYVNVPYPGRYGEAKLNVLGKDENEEVTFSVPVFSRGEFDLINVRGTIDIFTSMNEKVATVYTNSVESIAGKSRAELVAKWDAGSIVPGKYRAVAMVSWGDGTTTVEKEFNLGEKRLSLEGIEVNDFKLGDIAKFEILVKNYWNEKISDAYAELVVHSESGNVLADFKSANYDVEASGKELFLAYWDTKGVTEGSYDSTLFLRYPNSEDKQDLSLEVSKDEVVIIGAGYIITSGITGSGISKGLLIFLISLIVILALANLSWFLYLRKKLKK